MNARTVGWLGRSLALVCVLAALGVAGLADASGAKHRGAHAKTKITRGYPASTFDHSASAAFRSNSTRATFQCRADGGSWRACKSPFRAHGLKPGIRKLSVRAVRRDGTVDPTPAKTRVRVVSRRFAFGHSVSGRKLVVHRLGVSPSPYRALVVGQIHGDESQGRRVVRKLDKRYANVRGFEIWTVLSLNPDGNAAKTRRNAHKVDLNRNWGAGWSGTEPPSSGYYAGPRPFSEPESRAGRRLVERADPIVSIWYHQPWGATLVPSGRSHDAALRYARKSGLRPDRSRGGFSSGSAIHFENARLHQVAFVAELPGGRASQSLIDRHAKAVTSVARFAKRHR